MHNLILNAIFDNGDWKEGNMKRSSSVLAVALAVGIAGCTSLLAHNYLGKKEGTTPQGMAKLSAGKDISAGTNVEDRTIRLANPPKENTPADYYADAKATAFSGYMEDSRGVIRFSVYSSKLLK
jgi:Flp pilus assembly protein CpaB